jgi:hypothetical protein
MRLRRHRRNLVVWNQSAGPAGKHVTPPSTAPARTRRIRRWIRVGVLLAIFGLMHPAPGVRTRWRLTLAGVVLTAVGVMFRADRAGVVLLPGLLFLLSAPLIPAGPQADHAQRAELERELAAYSTLAQRCDLEATLDRYPDRVTYELRAILARQAMAAYTNRIPGA